jgi:ABC-type polysaccharide/polyol phosphate export permease
VAAWRASRPALDILVALTIADLRIRYGRGPWQLVKWLLDPFALVGIFLLLVVFVLDRPGQAPALSLACAVIPFQLAIMTVSNALGAISLRRSILLNVRFRRDLIPVSAALTEFVAFLASLVLLAMLMVVYGVALTPAALWLPAAVGATLLLAVSFAFPAALFGLWFPDMRPLAVSAVRALFFLAPGLVALSEIPGRANELVRINPLTGLFEAYRDILLHGQAPATWTLLIPVAAALLLLAACLPLYRREQGHFAELLG